MFQDGFAWVRRVAGAYALNDIRRPDLRVVLVHPLREWTWHGICAFEERPGGEVVGAGDLDADAVALGGEGVVALVCLEDSWIGEVGVEDVGWHSQGRACC